MKRRLTALASAGLAGAFLFAGPGIAGSGNGDSGQPGDTYKNKFSNEVGAEQACKGTDTVYYLGPVTLWPPNHKLAAPSVITAVADDSDGDGDTDDAEETTGLNTTASSSEELNDKGDGNTDSDYTPATDSEAPADDGTADTSHRFRAERSGTGDGRTYTVDFSAVFEDDTQPPGTNEYVCTSLTEEQYQQLNPSNSRPVLDEVPAFEVFVPHDMGDAATRDDRVNGN